MWPRLLGVVAVAPAWSRGAAGASGGCCLPRTAFIAAAVQAQFDIAAKRMTRVAKPSSRRVDAATELAEMEEAGRAAQAMLRHNEALLLRARTRAPPPGSHSRVNVIRHGAVYRTAAPTGRAAFIRRAQRASWSRLRRRHCGRALRKLASTPAPSMRDVQRRVRYRQFEHLAPRGCTYVGTAARVRPEAV